jgi:riboflavin kinase/FMN adenylyltransferase
VPRSRRGMPGRRHFAGRIVCQALSENSVVGPRASGFSSGKDGEAGDVGYIVDTAGCRQTDNKPLEARSSFSTEPNMDILSFNELPKLELSNTVITIGKFDGVHCGHQQLIRRVVEGAKRHGMKSVVLTFHPHPAVYFEPQKVPDPIISQDYKYRLIKTLGVDAILTLSYDSWIASLSPKAYVKKIIVEKLQAKHIWIGYDFSFGKNRSGNARTLMDLGEQYDFQTNVLGPQRIDGLVASSTVIRSNIKAGQLKEVSQLLGRCHVVDAAVLNGNRKKTRVGLPTIRVHVKEGMIPGSGIYSGITYVKNREIASVLHVVKTASDKAKDVHIEAVIIDCDDTIYGQDAELAFIRRLRDARSFRAIENLQMQINMDCRDTEEDVMKHKGSSNNPF